MIGDVRMARKDAADSTTGGAEPRPLRRRGGPATADGKAVVSRNAVTHGITSPQVPIPGVEDVSAWAAFRQSVLDDSAPVGAVEEALAERIAELFWRLRRVAPYEAELVAISRDHVEADCARRQAFGPKPESVEAAEEWLAAAKEAMHTLAVGQDPTAFVCEIAAGDFIDALTGEDEELEAQALPGFEEGVHSADRGGWNGALMRAAVVAMAAAREMDAGDLRKRVFATLAALVERRGRDVEEVLREQDSMRRERLLPPAQTLIAVSKYEAHLNRQLYQAVHELEALQARRRGQPIPLARVQISAGG